tara:strand:- start:189 stop:749 length:561 start_codon:yes stop_codon:yes gene_type:complete
MNKFWEKVEHVNAKLIPYAILALLVVIILEVGGNWSKTIYDFAHHYHTYILILDYIVIGIFVVDLIFLGIKAKSVKFFFKSYWLDLLAVIPLAIGFTIASKMWRAVAAVGQVGIGQAILHETLEARKGISAIGRTQKVAKYIRVGARSLRVVTKSRLFQKFKHHHDRHPHIHKKFKKDLRKKKVKK